MAAVSDDVQADGKSVAGIAAGDAGCGLLAHVDEEVKGVEAPNGVVYLLAADYFRQGADGKGGDGHGWAEEQVVLVEDLSHAESVPFQATKGEGYLLSRPAHGLFQGRSESVRHFVSVLGQEVAGVGGTVSPHDCVQEVDSVVDVNVYVGGFNGGAHVLKGHGRRLAYAAYFGVHSGGAEVGSPTDTQALNTAVEACGEVRGLAANAYGVPVVRPGQCLKQQGGVSDVAGDGPALAQLPPAAGARCDGGYPALGGLNAVQSAEGGGDANGAAAVAALG